MSKSTIDVLVRREGDSVDLLGSRARTVRDIGVEHGLSYIPRYRRLFQFSFLLVDDVPASCKLLSLLLKEFGALGDQMFMAYNLRDAEDILDRYPIDIVFSDLHLGPLSGLRLLERLRTNAQTARVPFVLVTNSPDQRRIEEALQKGVSSVLFKPLSIGTVASRLDAVLKESVVAQQGLI